MFRVLCHRHMCTHGTVMTDSCSCNILYKETGLGRRIMCSEVRNLSCKTQGNELLHSYVQRYTRHNNVSRVCGALCCNFFLTYSQVKHHFPSHVECNPKVFSKELHKNSQNVEGQSEERSSICKQNMPWSLVRF